MISALRIAPVLVLFATLLSSACTADDLSLGCIIEDVIVYDLPMERRMKLIVGGELYVVEALEHGPAAGKFQSGDSIVSVNSVPVHSKETFDAAVAAIAPGKEVSVSALRRTRRSWMASTAFIKPETVNTLVSKSMESHIDQSTQVTIYDYQRRLTKAQKKAKLSMAEYIERHPNVGLRVLEHDGKVGLAFSFCIEAVKRPFVKRIASSKNGKTFKLDVKSEDLKRISYEGTDWESATIPLNDEQIIQLKDATKPFGVIHMHGSEYKYEYKLKATDWAAMQMAISFYEMKTRE